MKIIRCLPFLKVPHDLYRLLASGENQMFFFCWQLPSLLSLTTRQICCWREMSSGLLRCAENQPGYRSLDLLTSRSSYGRCFIAFQERTARPQAEPLRVGKIKELPGYNATLDANGVVTKEVRIFDAFTIVMLVPFKWQTVKKGLRFH